MMTTLLNQPYSKAKSGNAATSSQPSETQIQELKNETLSFFHDLCLWFEQLKADYEKLHDATEKKIELAVKQSSSDSAFYLLSHRVCLSIIGSHVGRVVIRCERTQKMGPKQAPKSNLLFSGSLESHFEGSNQVLWKYSGRNISAKQAAHHLFLEFLQAVQHSLLH